jgi:predicted dehydrogenase
MKTLKTAVFGTGFMGRVHLEAIRRNEFVDAVAIAGRTVQAAQRLGAGFSVPAFTADYREILGDPAIDAVHVCTPNALHFSMAKDALLAGKHVMCEKPLAITVPEAEELTTLALKQGVRNAICHNIRFYPMVQQMRSMCESGELGDILVVQGTYFQDWLLYDTDWNWRVDARAAGTSRVLADVGSHWFDLAEHITGLRVTSLCSDLQTFHQTRKKPKQAVETFANKLLGPQDYVETPVDTEDFGAVLFRMGQRTRGSATVSQVSAGRKNRLVIEICGTKSSVAWDQERPDELWVGHREISNQIFVKDPSLLAPRARTFADLPGGHSEGYDDTFKQIFRRFYSSIRTPGEKPDYPQFADGLRQLKILDAALRSNHARAWVDIAPS